MNVSQGDYLYAGFVKKPVKRIVLKVKNVSEDHSQFEAKSAQYYHISDIPFFNCKVNNDPEIFIIANLGKMPAVTSIGGCLTHSYIGSKKIEGLGKIYFFYKPSSKDDLQQVIAGFNLAYKRLKTNNLLDFLPYLNFAIHNSLTFPSPDKMQGCYKKLEDSIGNICIFPERIEDANEMSHVILHEISHHLMNYIKKQQELLTDWTEAFYNISNVVDVSAEKIDQIVEKFLISGQNISEFIKTLDDSDNDPVTDLTDKQLFKKYLAAAAKPFKLSYKDLVLFSKEDKFDLLENILVKNKAKISIRLIKATAASQYSTKNINEFFAETVAFYLDGKKLLKDTDQLVSRTLSYIKRCAENKD